MKKIKLLLCLPVLGYLLLSCFSVVHASVWDAENEWDKQWEKRYQHWVKTQWTDDIFMNPAKPIYHKYATDCSDASYAMRLIFAYEHKLPFVVNDPARKGKLITNKKSTWDGKANGVRVRKFLEYIADVTSTKSLSHDTYPVALNDIKPGDVYVAPGVHSYQIVNVTDTGIAEVMASTTPRKERFLLRTPSFPFYVPESKAKHDGYRRFKTPENIRKSAKKQPGYSDEQFTLAKDLEFDYVKFTDIIAKRLGKRTETRDEKTTRLLLALCMYANDRAVYVYDALWHLQEIRKKDRQCLTRREYDDYSTPGRDKRLGLFFKSIRSHLDRSGRFDPRSRSSRWAKAVFAIDEPPAWELKLLNKFCMVQMTLGEELYMSLRELRQNMEGGHLVSDPHAPLQYRWGVVKTKYEGECKTY